MEKNKENQDTKRKALTMALERTDGLADAFMDILKQDFSGSEHPKRDFSATVEKLIPAEKAEDDLFETAETNAQDDERLHMSYQALLEDSRSCTRCGLCKTRKNVVFGTGCLDRPTVMVIGEGPGENEDLQGLPFVGKAGQYLDSWLSAISLDRDKNVYITNTVKCRPPQNRDPYPEEKKSCNAYLKQQIEIIHPQAILCLGKPASALMTGLADSSMGALRGRFFFYESIPMLCTYHPAAVLRNPELKRPVWEDLKKLARYLGLETGGGRR